MPMKRTVSLQPENWKKKQEAKPNNGIFLAALQGVPPELYEAAELDGAGIWGRFRHVTVAIISPVILYNLMIGTIGALNTFARIYVLTQGGKLFLPCSMGDNEREVEDTAIYRPI